MGGSHQKYLDKLDQARNTAIVDPMQSGFFWIFMIHIALAIILALGHNYKVDIAKTDSTVKTMKVSSLNFTPKVH